MLNMHGRFPVLAVGTALALGLLTAAGPARADEGGASVYLLGSGGFKGQASGVGATAAWNFELANRPASLRLHAFTEFDVRNRLEGDSVFLDFSIPLVMNVGP